MKRSPRRELADRSKPKRARPGEDRRRVILPDRRLDIDVELDLVAIRILDVKAVGDDVIRRADETGTRRDQLVPGLAQLGVGFPDLEPEVVHPDPAALRDRHRVLPHLDQEQLVMRPPRRKGRGRETNLFAGDRDLLPAQQVAIKMPRAIEISNVEDEMAELLHLHAVQNSRVVDPLEFTVRWPVRGYELDSRGHVNNAVYLSWAEEVATAHAEAAGYGRDWSASRGGGWIIRKTEITYHRPAVYGDEVELTVRVELVRGARGVRRTTIHRIPDRELLAEVLTEWVWVRLSDGRPVAAPRELVARAAAVTASTLAKRRAR
jgi:acyl-CoA thioester hydrolase